MVGDINNLLICFRSERAIVIHSGASTRKPEKASRRQAKYFNRTARARTLKVGDKVLDPLPTDANKLLLQRKGPFSIKKKVNKLDFQVCMKGKLKTFHDYMFKKYIERNADQ